MDAQERCSYILPKKKRKCKMLVKKGKRFCGEHAIFDPDNQERIVCPNDPKHTVNKAELEEHLARRCNSRLPEDPWIVEGLNSLEDIEADDFCTAASSGKCIFDEKQVDNMCKKVEEAYEAISREVHVRQLSATVVENFMVGTAEISETRRKHLIQHSSIIGHLLEAGLLKDEDGTCIVDLGSGKAELPYWMAKLAPKCRFLLVDCQGMRNKYDNKAIKENPSVKMLRLRCSIEHLDLSKVEVAKEAENLVAVCKHFCGKATDWGIRCLENALTNGVNLRGFALAPCCHHKSTFTDYVNKAFLSEVGIVSRYDFSLLRYVASWAVCGMLHHESQKVENELKASPKRELGKQAEGRNKGPGNHESGAMRTREEKEQLGRKAKVLLEFGRVVYLRRLGFDVEVHRYVDFSVSPENLLIVGKKAHG